MSFRLGDIIVKDILYGLASNISTGDPLYVLTQLSEAQIAITAESNDVTDKDGNIVIREYRAKQGEFTAVNAFLNGNVIAAAGATTDLAASGNVLVAPKIIKVKASAGSAVLDNVVAGSITVNQYFGDGALGKKYELGLVASDTEFAVTTGSTTIYNFPDVTAGYVVATDQSEFPSTGDATKVYIETSTSKAYAWNLEDSEYVEQIGATIVVVDALPSTGTNGAIYVVTGDNTVHTCEVTTTPDGTTTVTLPTDPEAEYFMVKYKRTFTSGAIISNSAKQFPSSVNMLLKVLYYDPCAKDDVKAAYVEMPSLKMSPEQTLSFNPESPTMDINATLEIDYCSDDKELYRIYFVDEVDAA
jgi:hypothetical protein